MQQQAVDIHALAKVGRHVDRPQRCVRGKQQRLENAQVPAQHFALSVVYVDHGVCFLRRMKSGPNVSVWRISISPWRTSSRLEAKVEARTVARSDGLAR